ncbi:MAG: hypothetical protein QOJ68_1729 [Blastococcus sp.]|jgi:hypothetical protein|nr:hypothetical protein [Blastococcus sp.]
MSEPTDRSTDASDAEEIDDPGRDPRGLKPPRNLFGGGADQDSGQGSPEGSAQDTGPADKPGDAADGDS